MEIDTDKMIAKQQQMNQDIANTEPERVTNDTVCYVEKTMPTKSHLVVHDAKVMVTRYMYNKIFKVSFELSVLAVDIVQYMDMDDKTFVMVSDR